MMMIAEIVIIIVWGIAILIGMLILASDPKDWDTLKDDEL